MAETTNLSIRIDRDLKNEADRMFNALGMNLTTAINVFVRQSVRQKKIPFEIALAPDGDDRRVTMLEAKAVVERIRQHSVANGMDKMSMEEIDAEIAAARVERKARRAVP
jgi:DNA-damage-inducible protein J